MLTEIDILGISYDVVKHWKHVGKCFDPISLECIDFQRLSQIIANLTRGNLAEREAEIMNLPWTQTEKDNALARCRIITPCLACQKNYALSQRCLMKTVTLGKRR